MLVFTYGAYEPGDSLGDATIGGVIIVPGVFLIKHLRSMLVDPGCRPVALGTTVSLAWFRKRTQVASDLLSLVSCFGYLGSPLLVVSTVAAAG